MFLRTVFLSSLIFILAGCTEVELASHVAKSVTPPSQEGLFKVGNPYQISGKWYRPSEKYDFVETGIASWYGPQFNGNYTANGEIFDMNELTAAHRTLQMPSIVRVTNLENGRSLIVRVNDRGPYKRGRVMDVSKRAAELLGFKNKGTAKIRIELLPEESRAVAAAAKRGEDTKGFELAMNKHLNVQPQKQQQEERQDKNIIPVSTLDAAGSAPVDTVERVALTPDLPGHINGGTFYPDPVVKQLPVVPTNIFVQAGSFSSQENAIALANRLGRGARVYQANVNGREFFRVRIPTSDVGMADKLLDEMAAGGNAQAIIVVE